MQKWTLIPVLFCIVYSTELFITHSYYHQLQRGTMRTNCLDCLDRTNRVQTYLGLDTLNKMLDYLGVANSGVIVQRFNTKLEEMWKDNGNRISQIYAGTGALQGSKVCGDVFDTLFEVIVKLGMTGR